MPARQRVLPVLALALHNMTFMALMTRARLADELDKPYVVTAAAKGVAPMAVRRRHALPNAALGIATLVGLRLGAFVADAIVFGGAILAEAALAFVGLGDPHLTSWGQLIASGYSFVAHAWWMWAFPAMALSGASALVALLADRETRISRR